MTESACQIGPEQKLSVVISEPEAAANSTGVILLNAGLVHRIGPFRMNVQLGRALAKSGFCCMRMDFSGLGYSPNPDNLETERENILRDTNAAIDHLKTHHAVEQIVLLGLCSGADNAFRIALERDDVAGVVMLDGYAYQNLKYRINHYLRRVGRLGVWIDWFRSKLRPTQAVKPSEAISVAEAEGRRDLWEVEQPDLDTFRDNLRQLLGRGTELFFVYSGGMIECNYQGQLKDVAPEARSEQVRVKRYPAADHTYILNTDRSRLITDIVDWVQQTFGAKT